MSDHQIVSVILDFALFNLFVGLEVAALAVFYVSSRPRRGRVRSAAIWYINAAVIFVLCLISTVWSAPAQKAFIDADQKGEPYFQGERFQKVIIGLAFAAVGVACMAIGAYGTSRQRRTAAREALLET